ncbi:MAG: hypothetical protein LBR25_10305 [Erysipelotrichaceae bacterium]|jgi:hypothetical protein|nr:hypothetical protein [Erysipelotrichaceae bacterium]
MKKKWYFSILISLMMTLSLLPGYSLAVQAGEDRSIAAGLEESTQRIVATITNGKADQEILVDFYHHVSPFEYLTNNPIITPAASFQADIEIRNDSDYTYVFTGLEMPKIFGNFNKLYYSAFADDGFSAEDVALWDSNTYFNQLAHYYANDDGSQFNDMNVLNQLLDRSINDGDVLGEYGYGFLRPLVEEYAYRNSYFTLNADRDEMPVYDDGFDSNLSFLSWQSISIYDLIDGGYLPQEIGPHQTIILKVGYGFNARMNKALFGSFINMAPIFTMQRVGDLQSPSLKKVKDKDVVVNTGDGSFENPYLAEVDFADGVDSINLSDFTVVGGDVQMYDEYYNELTSINIPENGTVVVYVAVDTPDDWILYQLTFSRSSGNTPTPTPNTPGNNDSTLSNGAIVPTAYHAGLWPYLAISATAIVVLMLDRPKKKKKEKKNRQDGF